MGFFIIEGTMGSGKTYYGAEVIYQALSEGAHVMTNVDLIPEEVERLGWSERVIMLPENPAEWVNVLVAGVEGQENCVVIDEATIMFHIHDGQKKRDENRPIFDLLRWSRKFGLDVFMISQSAENIDPALRRMCMQVVECTNTETLPLIGWFIPKIIGRFRRTSKTQRGVVLWQSSHRFSAKVGAFYKTDATCGIIHGLKTNASRKKKKRHDQSLGKLGGLALIALLLYMVIGGYRFYKSGFGINRAWAMLPDGTKPAENSGGSKAPQVPQEPREPAKRFFYAVSQTDGLTVFADGGEVYRLGARVGSRVVAGLARGADRITVKFEDGSKDIIHNITTKGPDRWKRSQQLSPRAAGSLPLASLPVLPLN